LNKSNLYDDENSNLSINSEDSDLQLKAGIEKPIPKKRVN